MTDMEQVKQALNRLDAVLATVEGPRAVHEGILMDLAVIREALLPKGETHG